jgi:hypothetical protein
MSTNFKRWWGRSWPLVVVFTLCLLGLVASCFPAWINSILHTFLGASCLGLTIDRFFKREFVADVVKDTAHAIIGFSMPELLKVKIREIIKTDLVREQMRMNYSIQPDGDRVRVFIESSWILKSFAGSPANYKQTLAFEEVERPEVYEMRCDSQEQQARYCIRDLKPLVESGVSRFSAKEIQVKTDSTYPISSRYSISGPREGSDVFVFGGATVGLVVTTIDTEEYEFSLVIGKGELDVIQTPNRWEFNRAFLRGQHLRIRWKPKEAYPQG